jgi:hypothetical protein
MSSSSDEDVPSAAAYHKWIQVTQAEQIATNATCCKAEPRATPTSSQLCQQQKRKKLFINYIDYLETV